MKRLLVSIRGTNASGKSTIPIQMLKTDPDYYYVKKPYNGKMKVMFTVFPKYKFIAIGRYSEKGGGLDGMETTALGRKAAEYAIKKFPEYSLLMEGFVASGIFSSYSEFFHRVEANFGLRVVILNFLPPLEVNLQRVLDRADGKLTEVSEKKMRSVLGKRKSVVNNIPKFKSEGFIVLKIDNSNTTKEQMLPKFLRLCAKYQEDEI